jgi:hypothetical protein
MRSGAKRRERSGVPVDALLVGYGTSETIPDVPLAVGREYRMCVPMAGQFKMVAAI